MTVRTVCENQSTRFFVEIEKSGDESEIKVWDKAENQKMVFSMSLDNYVEIANLVDQIKDELAKP